MRMSSCKLSVNSTFNKSPANFSMCVLSDLMLQPIGSLPSMVTLPSGIPLLQEGRPWSKNLHFYEQYKLRRNELQQRRLNRRREQEETLPQPLLADMVRPRANSLLTDIFCMFWVCLCIELYLNMGTMCWSCESVERRPGWGWPDGEQRGNSSSVWTRLRSVKTQAAFRHSERVGDVLMMFLKCDV